MSDPISLPATYWDLVERYEWEKRQLATTTDDLDITKPKLHIIDVDELPSVQEIKSIITNAIDIHWDKDQGLLYVEILKTQEEVESELVQHIVDTEKSIKYIVGCLKSLITRENKWTDNLIQICKQHNIVEVFEEEK